MKANHDYHYARDIKQMIAVIRTLDDTQDEVEQASEAQSEIEHLLALLDTRLSQSKHIPPIIPPKPPPA